MLAIKWLDKGPAENTTDLIPRHWFNSEVERLFKRHTVLDPEGANSGKVHCSITVGATAVEIDYGGEHAARNREQGFQALGCTRLTFAEPGRQGAISVWWRDEGDTAFSNDWLYEVEERVAQTTDLDRFQPDSGAAGQRELFRKVAIRQGQSLFRDQLIAAYGGRCAVTGCAIEEVLQAAHIEPYSEGRNNSVSNGILLRADIHTLFDLGIIRIKGDYSIEAPGTVRSEFALPQKLTVVPANDLQKPCPRGLERKWASLQALEPV